MQLCSAHRKLLLFYCLLKLNALSFDSILDSWFVNADMSIYTFPNNHHESTLVLVQGDLTEFQGDAIVNAANERMLGGGGVDGAIHRAAGRELYEECLKVPEVEEGVRCPTGQARITKGYKLPAKYVIHTVGPIYESDAESAPLLANAYKSSLQLANEHNLKTVAFPAISTGVFGYPKYKAAEVSLKAVADAIGEVREVHFILFGSDMLAAYQKAANSLLFTIINAESKCTKNGVCVTAQEF
ncbi:hypothetical protein CEUSTIGMA_g10791.t1 [Chlamydomonas eustigma]|uniref:Macro domain-containing protein n=1 Tax=Chlamydomonas eustigma TaxID=1157962 RepID=A0A250XK20_9CHLO|nr:hypothetical protein CEUSTIGMA_g10791.t1 [Chlamydomonas eustigma]|eukprot:GAX83366.1 hypothetical protein CEUSTIGMA_g10791.t1 [Chlamydomonas eustigma]